jgi:uncharacterized LabA/DUF88 family protein
LSIRSCGKEDGVLRVRVYVDGFNLYFGLKEKYSRQFHWLDLQALSGRLTRPSQQLDLVQYFTARVRDVTSSRHRQDTYLQALSSHCPLVTIHEGRFQRKTGTCRSCQNEWLTYEEKESDVSLAVSLVEDAALDRFDVALLISADSDLCPAVRAVRRVRPGKRIVAVFPPARHSDDLRRTADAVFRLGRDKLSQCQLPPEVITPGGIKLTRPAYWS